MTEWQHRHVRYQIEANGETNTIKVELGQNEVISRRYGPFKVDSLYIIMYISIPY